jgi:hypothetical protein
MTTASERLAIGRELEDDTASWLRSHGWEVVGLGQRAMPAQTQAVLKFLGSRVIHLPDLLVSRLYPDGKRRASYVDTKNTQRDTPYPEEDRLHFAASESVDVLVWWARFTNIPTWLVFGDGCTTSVLAARDHGERRPASANEGSGDPYTAIRCRGHRERTASPCFHRDRIFLI